mgnify:CR=1 FL=1
MSTLTISDTTSRQLAQVATTQAITADILAEKAIRQFLRVESERILEREQESFRAMHSQLLQEFPGDFVAIRQGKLLDHDADQLALYLRIDEQYPDEIILITQVHPEIEETYRIQSPRVKYE